MTENIYNEQERRQIDRVTPCFFLKKMPMNIEKQVAKELQIKMFENNVDAKECNYTMVIAKLSGLLINVVL